MQFLASSGQLLDHFWQVFDQLWTAFGQLLGNFWVGLGQLLSSFLNTFGPLLGNFWAIFGRFLAEVAGIPHPIIICRTQYSRRFWHFGVFGWAKFPFLATFLSPFWAILGSFWKAFGQLLGSFWAAFGPRLDHFWTTFEQLLGSFWAAFGQLLASFWSAFGSFLDDRWWKKIGKSSKKWEKKVSHLLGKKWDLLGTKPKQMKGYGQYCPNPFFCSGLISKIFTFWSYLWSLFLAIWHFFCEALCCFGAGRIIWGADTIAENENVNFKRSDADRSGRFRNSPFFSPELYLGGQKFSGRFRNPFLALFAALSRALSGFWAGFFHHFGQTLNHL